MFEFFFFNFSSIKGVVDPIEQVSEITKKFNLPFHVDSCIGGFVLPFAEQCKLMKLKKILICFNH